MMVSGSQRILKIKTTVGISALACLLNACVPAESNPQQGMPPPEVSVITVEPRDVPAVFEYTGETAGSREVEVRARVKGILLKRNYLEGGNVAAGQSLFTIDSAPYEAALALAQADVTSMNEQLAKAKRNTARLKPLYEEKVISQQDYDDVISNEVIAEANLKAARARLTQAKLDLEYTRVKSPVAGIAGRSLRSEGNYITGSEVLLTTVTQIDPIFVLFGISDEERLKLNRETSAGQLVLPENDAYTVTVKLAEGKEYKQSGRLTFSDVRVSGSTGTSEARAEIPNPDGLLRPGQFVRVALNGAHRPEAILVPQRAVLEGPNGKFVYVVDRESNAVQRSVVVGEWMADEWIITSGLNRGDKVIVDGVMKIGPGAPVSVVEPATQTPEQKGTTNKKPSLANTTANH